jgi:hypothetical protein
MTTEEEFQPILEVGEVRKLTSSARAKETDMVWAERISHLTLGQAFKTTRPDTETVRQFKARLNRAANHSGRTLDWTTLDPIKDPNSVLESSKFLAKIKAIDVEAQTASTANGTTETGNAPDSSENGSETAPDATVPPSGRRR